MKRIIPSIFCLICIGISFSDCRKDISNLVDDDPATGTYPNVNEALWPYFQRFENEAALRNIVVDLQDAQITGVISDIPTNHVLGQCSYSSAAPKKLTIDLPFWNTSSDLGKEFVIFHELGHCYLGRLHDETKDSQGFCKSIMRSGLEDCRIIIRVLPVKNILMNYFSKTKRSQQRGNPYTTIVSSNARD